MPVTQADTTDAIGRAITARNDTLAREMYSHLSPTCGDCEHCAYVQLSRYYTGEAQYICGTRNVSLTDEACVYFDRKAVVLVP